MEEAQAIKFGRIRRMLWPVEKEELKKFLPMAMMMFLILFNYSMLRSIKDGFVVTHIGTEAIGFLKIYFVLPAAILTMVIYAKLCNTMSGPKVFYTITTFFASYLFLFGVIIYPNLDSFHPDHEKITALANSYPHLQWFIKIAGKWTFASFYVIAELWGSVMLSLLFWQFANQITKINEAKRFYSMFGLLGQFGLILTGVVLTSSLGGDPNAVKKVGFEGVISILVFSTILVMVIYAWMQRYVLTDPKYYNPEKVVGGKKKNKPKLSLIESFRVIFTSKYLGLIAMLVIAYGISINLVEIVWKDNVRKLHPTDQDYTAFMGSFQQWQGIGTILFMIIGSNILRLMPWRIAALSTPIMMLVTGTIFLSLTIFGKDLERYIDVLAPPLVFAVVIGTIQNILSKATKYSLFDPTKEMAYIPLDDELKTKGKAAVDVVGGRLGKSGGGLIQSTFFMLLPSFSLSGAVPFFAMIFFFIVMAWIFAVGLLSKEYEIVIKSQK